MRLQQLPCVTRAWDFCPIFRIFFPLFHRLHIYYHWAKIALILSEFPLPYLPISINCPPPRMAGLSIAGEAELQVPHTDTPCEAFFDALFYFPFPLLQFSDMLILNLKGFFCCKDVFLEVELLYQLFPYLFHWRVPKQRKKVNNL